MAGSNPADASVSAAAMLSLVEPVSTGVRCDYFAPIYQAHTGQRRSPGGRARNSERCGGSTGAFRDLSLGDCLAPAIRTAEEGLPLTLLISAHWRDAEGKIVEESETARVYWPAPKPSELRDSPQVAGSLLAGAFGQRIAEDVQSKGGYLTTDDLESIGQFCRERGIYFVVDSIQGLGGLEFDVSRFKVDFMSAGSYKYLLGPVSVGCFYCRKELLGDVWPSRVGHRNVVDNMTLDYDLALWPSAQRFEAGAMNYLGLHGLDASLEIIERAGVENIERHILRLTDSLIGKLKQKGYRVVSSQRPEERSGIVVFAHQAHDPEELLERLSEAGVVVSLRHGGIRASAHLYNNEEDIARLIEALPQ